MAPRCGKTRKFCPVLSHVVYLSDLVILWNYLMKGGSFMANTEIFLRNIFGTTRPNIRPLVLALNITNDLLFEQHISMSDIKATKHIYPDVARLLHKKPETVYKSVIRLAHRCWDALVEQDLVLSYLGRSMKQEPDPSVFITYLISTEQVPNFCSEPESPEDMRAFSKERAESCGDSAPERTWRSHEPQSPAALR